jgi:hypothetical protein
MRVISGKVIRMEIFGGHRDGEDITHLVGPDMTVTFAEESEPESARDRVHRVLEHDPEYNDLQTYLEGGVIESRAAARRLDERAMRSGQMSFEEFNRRWPS